MAFTLAELDEARALVSTWVPPTLAYPWPLLCEAVGTEVWVKHENHTPTGAFKVRGGLIYVHRLAASGEVPGLISATRGNHGQSLAFAGRVVGLPVTIVVPEGNSPAKNAAMIGLGAELVVHGRDYQAAREHVAVLAASRGLVVVPPFHPDLVLGVATLSAELFERAGELDVAYVPVGMGTGICGLMGVRDVLGRSTEVVGVVAQRAPATALSFAAGHAVATEHADTFADGVACRAPGPDAIAAILEGAARIVAVTEDEVAASMRVLFETTHNVAEPAGALGLAGLLQERDRLAGMRAAVILSGGNVDTPVLASVLSGATPRP